jgi:hypothetical protein
MDEQPYMMACCRAVRGAESLPGCPSCQVSRAQDEPVHKMSPDVWERLNSRRLLHHYCGPRLRRKRREAFLSLFQAFWVGIRGMTADGRKLLV